MRILVWYEWDAGIIDNGKSIVFSKTFPDKKLKSNLIIRNTSEFISRRKAY